MKRLTDEQIARLTPTEHQQLLHDRLAALTEVAAALRDSDPLLADRINAFVTGAAFYVQAAANAGATAH